MAPGTWVAYKRSVEKFIMFRTQYQLSQCWPVGSQHIAAFIAFLSIEGFAPASINLSISALTFVHKINGWQDPSDNFFIKKLKEGCRRKNPREDARLPISPVILQAIINKLTSICKSLYEAEMFKAAFLLAFFGFLRVGEFSKTGNQATYNSRVIAVDDVEISGSSMLITIRGSKTDQRGATAQLKIDSSSYLELCPVKAMAEYLKSRPVGKGPLFIHFNRETLTSRQFTRMLKEGIKLIGLCPTYFSAHSLRIGAATAAASSGFSDDVIKKMGRWKSDAFQVYIRPQSMVSIRTLNSTNHYPSSSQVTA